MRFVSLFAGVGGFDIGFERAGMTCVAQVEIDKRCNAVLRRHYPGVMRRKDVRGSGAHNLPSADVVVFGSPCQDFSIAGKRAGLDGKRSGLFYEAIRIVSELNPTFAVWENVPGALSANAGRDFAHVLATFRECGARDIAWRTLNAQGFGVPQHRRRVFLVADFRAERAAQILFESEGGERHPAPGRAAREGDQAGAAAPGTHQSRFDGIANALSANPANRLSPDDNYAVTALTQRDGQSPDDNTAQGGKLVVFKQVLDAEGWPRRFMPVECERLQGFPDGWTAWGVDESGVRVEMSDTARYRMLGNAVAVPVAAWVAQRMWETAA